jgi:hypothetical protein
MKLPAGIDKWGSAVLGLVSLLLVVHLVRQYRGLHPGNSRSTAVSTKRSVTSLEKTSFHESQDLAQYDPTVHFAALKALDSRPLPEEDRNPFEYVGEAAPPPPQAPAPLPKVAPPPPPPPPLKAMGYNELPGGKGEAMITYNDDLQVVHEGDLIGTKFRVVKIIPTMIVVEDGETHKTLELPFPQ